jgi:hypothetical protein
MNASRCFFVETEAAAFTWIGGAPEPEGSFLWLCNVDGKRVLRVPAAAVKETTIDETAQRITRDARAKLARRN